jgi:hypothetical protein
VLSLGYLVLFVFAVVPALQAAIEVSATLSPGSFPLDRAAALNITATGVRSFQPEIPEVDGLSFHRRGQSTQMEFINGALSSSVTLTYLVQADRVGSFTIPAIQVSTKNGTAMTRAIPFEVTAPQTATITQQSASAGASTTRLRSGEAAKLAFLRVTPAKERSYLGEVVPVQIQVFFRDGIKANLNSLPQLHGEGYLLQQLGREPEQTREHVNNTSYAVLTWESALSGIKEGVHEISIEIDATLLLPEQRRRSSSGHSMFNDPFFNSLFSSYQEKNVKVASLTRTLTVLPLPDKGKPKDFSGAIGDFRLSVSANPVELSHGDPITLNMTVSGQGNFDRVQAPKLSTEKGWKTYTPSSEFLEYDGSNPGRGKKVFEQALVAKDVTLKEIPAIEFSYFDPTAATYKTLSTNPIPLTIKRAVVETAMPEPVKKELRDKVNESAKSDTVVEPPVSGLAPLQLVPGYMDQKLTPLFTRQWFQLVAVLLFLLLTTAVIMKIRAAHYANNPRLQRDQEMKHLLGLGMKEIDQSLTVNDTRGFLEICRKIIQEQLALVWEVSSGAITLADLQKRLPEDSVLLAVFRAADESAYGGQKLSQQEMKEFVDRLRSELEGLR